LSVLLRADLIQVRETALMRIYSGRRPSKSAIVSSHRSAATLTLSPFGFGLIVAGRGSQIAKECKATKIG